MESMETLDAKRFAERNKNLIGERTYAFLNGPKSAIVMKHLRYDGFLKPDGASFSPLGERFFVDVLPQRFEYASFALQSIRPVVFATGPLFEQLLSILEKVGENTPDYEDRTMSIQRRSGKEIPSSLFASAIARALLNSDIGSSIIAVEQSDSLGRLIIRSSFKRPQSPEMKAFVNFLRFTGLIPFFFFSVLKRAAEDGLLMDNSHVDYFETALVYYSFAYRNGLSRGKANEPASLSLSERKVLGVVKLLGTVKRSDVVFKTGLSARMASYALSSLVSKKILKVEGGPSFKSRVYVLNKEPKKVS